ncbi:AAA domain-containing protein [Phytoactinopolyspora halotolerans]|uniref:AAA domain-containing protein n=2 Tax=Phytoactinopolyspora halotolerans TaxID=1981512 RepID=A0A6L9S7S3_9ACTN|nr:AAA domain-containing protein [Phytoactinopolyspora halotolerans]
MIESGLGTGASFFAPQVGAWSAEVVNDLRERYNDRPDVSGDAFIVKLERQLKGAPDSTILLAAELLTVHALPLANLTQESKRRRIETVLGWMQHSPTLPSEVVEAFAEGSWHGGQGAHQHIWRWLAHLVEFLQHWWELEELQRQKALNDPWEWRNAVRATEVLPSLRECLLYFGFPHHFLPIINVDDKQRILKSFSDEAARSGDQDRDLFELTLRLQERHGGYFDYYASPYVEQWRPDRDRSTRRAWLVRPRRPQGGEDALVERWRREGFVSLAATHLGVVEPGSDRHQVAAAVEEGYQHTDYAQRLQLTTEYHIFLTRMASDDVVVTIVDGQVWIGQVTGDATYSDSDEGRLRRPTEWADQSFDVDQLPAPLAADIDQQGAVVDLTGALDALLSLVEAEDQAEPHDEAPALQFEVDVPSLRSANAELAMRLHIEQEWLQESLDVLQDRQQVIFYGPPGTGKTYLARALARHVTDPDAVRLVQFHPSYTYEDFFEGYRPVSGADGTVGFQLQPGPLRQIASEARDDPGRPYVLIVDEINRANLAKVFGELYYLLEYRRDSVRLQYSPGESFTLPPNVFVVGTMNTADRSIALVDAAIRRRFAFIELHPDEPPVRDLLRNWLHANHKDLDRAFLLDALNDAIGAEDRDFKIGPSYLMTADTEREGGLARIWEYSILPLLQEHYYGRLGRDQVRARYGLASIQARIAAQIEQKIRDDSLPGQGTDDPDSARGPSDEA